MTIATSIKASAKAKAMTTEAGDNNHIHKGQPQRRWRQRGRCSIEKGAEVSKWAPRQRKGRLVLFVSPLGTERMGKGKLLSPSAKPRRLITGHNHMEFCFHAGSILRDVRRDELP